MHLGEGGYYDGDCGGGDDCDGVVNHHRRANEW